MTEQEKTARTAAATDNMENAAGEIMPDLLHGARKALIWRGIIFMIFGVLIITRPVPAIAVTVIIAGIYVAIEGAAFLVQALKLPHKFRSMLLLNAVIMILLGLAAIILIEGHQMSITPISSGRTSVMHSIFIVGATFLISATRFFSTATLSCLWVWAKISS